MENTGFVGGTLVHTDKGLIPIKDIKVGDLIVSRKITDLQSELIFKPVLEILKMENTEVLFTSFTPLFIENLPFEQRSDLSLYLDLIVSPNQIFWGNDKGWITAKEIELEDFVVLKEGTKAYCYSGGGSDGCQALERIFETDDKNKGFIPDFSHQTGIGRFVNLLTGKSLNFGIYKPVFNDLFITNNGYVDSNKSLDVDGRWGGFDAGEWKNIDNIKSTITTAYSIKVSDTYSYFVSEHGIWVR